MFSELSYLTVCVTFSSLLKAVCIFVVILVQLHFRLCWFGCLYIFVPSRYLSCPYVVRVHLCLHKGCIFGCRNAPAMW